MILTGVDHLTKLYNTLCIFLYLQLKSYAEFMGKKLNRLVRTIKPILEYN